MARSVADHGYVLETGRIVLEDTDLTTLSPDQMRDRRGPFAGLNGLITPYTLTVTDLANGCTHADTVVVTLSQDPPVANAGPDQTVGASAYTWTGTPDPLDTVTPTPTDRPVRLSFAPSTLSIGAMAASKLRPCHCGGSSFM